MTKQTFMTFLGVLSITACLGQHAWQFRSENCVGLSTGEMGGYGRFQTVNGLSRASWFLGLGAGLDYYRFRSVPLFLSVKRDLPVPAKGSGLFLNLDGGIDVPWYKRGPSLYRDVTSTFRPGLYWSTGLGYQWRLPDHPRQALLVSAAYGIKKLTEHQTVSPVCADPPSCTVNSETYTYQYLNRTLLLSVGFRF